MKNTALRGLLALSTLVLIAVIAVGRAGAARLPDWAQSIADAAPPLPEQIVEHDSRILLQETVLTVDPDGTLHTRRRTATQALSPQAAEIGVGFFPFDEDTQKLRSKAWHVSAEGKTKKSGRLNELDLTFGDVFLTDARTRVVAVPGVEAGSLVFFEFNAEETPKQLAYQELFFNDVPTDRVRVRLEVPAGWHVSHAWLRQDGPAPTIVGTRYTWELEHLEVPPLLDDLAEPYSHVAPLLQISLAPSQDQALDVATFRDWSEVGEWYRELSSGRDAANEAIAAAVEEAVADRSPAFFDEIEAVSIYVRDKVRYVAKHIGIGGYQPRHATEVLTNLYGDCKDKSTLLRTMLAVRGHDAYPMLINVSQPETVSEDVPSLLAFDHFVLGIPVPTDAEIPPRLAPAIVPTDVFGPLLVVDATNEFASLGSIPAEFGGRRALVIGDEAQTLARLPDDDPAAHGALRRLDAEMAQDGSARMTLTEEYWGDPAATLRVAYTNSVREFESDSTRELESIWTGSKLESIEIMPENGEGRFVRTSSLTLPAPAADGTTDLFQVFPSALEMFPRISLSGRIDPVVYPFAMTLRGESRIAGVPASTAQPLDYSKEGDGWNTWSAHTLTDGVLESYWELQLSRRRFGPDEFTHLKRLWSAARKSSRPALRRGEE